MKRGRNQICYCGSQKEIFGMHELFMLLEYENERESMIKEPEVNLFNL